MDTRRRPGGACMVDPGQTSVIANDRPSPRPRPSPLPPPSPGPSNVLLTHFQWTIGATLMLEPHLPATRSTFPCTRPPSTDGDTGAPGDPHENGSATRYQRCGASKAEDNVTAFRLDLLQATAQRPHVASTGRPGPLQGTHAGVPGLWGEGVASAGHQPSPGWGWVHSVRADGVSPTCQPWRCEHTYVSLSFFLFFFSPRGLPGLLAPTPLPPCPSVMGSGRPLDVPR